MGAQCALRTHQRQGEMHRAHVHCASMSMDDRPEPAQRLEEARQKAGFSTGQEACRRFGWKWNTYKDHENGKRGLGRAVSTYAKAFKVSEAWLQFGDSVTDPQLRRIIELFPKMTLTGRKALVVSAEAFSEKDEERD